MLTQCATRIIGHWLDNEWLRKIDYRIDEMVTICISTYFPELLLLHLKWLRQMSGNILNRFSCLKYVALWLIFFNISSQVANQPYPSFGVNNKHQSPMDSLAKDQQWGALVFSSIY